MALGCRPQVPYRLDGDRDKGADHKSDEDAAAHAAHDEDAGHQQCECEDHRRHGGDRTEAGCAKANRWRGLPGGTDEAGVDEPDEPIPAVMASLSCMGTASNTSLRSPVTASSTMINPSMTTRPIASGQVSEPTTVVARNELMPSPAANANGSRAMRPNRIVMTPAASDLSGNRRLTR
jgi:hypothetical protein